MPQSHMTDFVRDDACLRKKPEIVGVLLCGLPQAEIACNEEDYDDQTDDVDNLVHVRSPFFT
jgi:hypothetical protein